MRRSWDLFVVASTITLIGVFSWLLHRERSRAFMDREGESIGTVSYRYRVARKKNGSTVVWQDVDQNSSVYRNDWIRTDDLSEATVKLNDEIQIELDQNTMIVLSREDSESSLKLEGGSLRIRRLTGSGGPLRLFTESSRYRLLQGDLEIRRVGKTEILQTGEKKALIQDEASPDKKPIFLAPFSSYHKSAEGAGELESSIFRPELPAPDTSYFVLPGEKKMVQFSWKGGDHAILEVATDPFFTGTRKEIPAGSGEASLTLEPGQYFWRVHSFDPEESSVVRKLTIYPRETLSLLSPVEDEIIRSIEEKTPVKLRWKPTLRSGEFVVELSADPAFSSILASRLTRASSLGVFLPPGQFFWRVHSRNRSGEAVLPSAVASFRIRPDGESLSILYPPEGIHIAQERILEAGGILFRWDTSTPPVQLVLQKGEKTLLEIRREKPFYRVPLETYETGKYSFALEDSSGKRIQSHFFLDEAYRPEVEAEAPTEKPGPVAKPTRRPTEGKNAPPGRDPGPLANSDRDSSKEETSPGSAPVSPSLLTGLAEEPAPEVTLPPPVRILSPGNRSTVDMTDADTILFRWSSSRSADAYRFQLFHGGKTIHTREFSTTSYVFKELTLLDVGSFQWSVTPLNKAKSLEGEERKAEFRIVLRDEPGVVKDINTE